VDLAGEWARPAPVLVRSRPSIRRRSASRRRPRRCRRRTGSRAGGRHGDFLGHGAERWQDRVHSDAVGLHGDASAPGLDRRDPRRSGRRGIGGRDGGPERHRRPRRALRLLRRASDERRAGLRRPARALASACGAGNSARGAAGGRGGRARDPRRHCRATCGPGRAPGRGAGHRGRDELSRCERRGRHARAGERCCAVSGRCCVWRRCRAVGLVGRQRAHSCRASGHNTASGRPRESTARRGRTARAFVGVVRSRPLCRVLWVAGAKLSARRNVGGRAGCGSASDVPGRRSARASGFHRRECCRLLAVGSPSTRARTCWVDRRRTTPFRPAAS
jgi:hypothetical protein